MNLPIAKASRRIAATVILSTLTIQAQAQDQKILVSIPSDQITAFCMGLRIARHPNFPGPRTKYKLEYENVAMLIAQVPVNVANNQINIGECSGISTVINAWNKGAKNLVVFAFGSLRPVFQLVTSTEISKLSDLKGKAIGIPGIQSAGAEAAETILRRGANLLPQRDYDFVSVGAGPATMAAVIAKKVDAIPYFPPLSFELEKYGMKILADQATYAPQYVTGTHIVNREWAEKNRPQFIRLIKSMIETGDWLKDPKNEAEVVAWFGDNISAGNQTKLDKAAAQRTYNFYIKDARLAFDGYAPESSVRANLAILKERGYLKDSEIPPLGQVFDFSFLNQALREMGRPEVKEFSK